MRAAILISSIALVIASSAELRAEPTKPGSVLTKPGSASGLRRPRAPRLFHTPTAYLQPSGGVFISTGTTHRGNHFGAAALGVGGLAEVGVQASDELGACPDCTPDDPVADAVAARSAWFKIGVAEDRFFDNQPAVALGFQAQIGTAAAGPLSELRAARMYLVASRTLGAVRLHLGAELWDGGMTTVSDERVIMHDGAISDRIRPFAGFGWTPSIYPRTTVIGEVSWVPTFQPERIDLRWLAAWGVRYQAFRWGSVDLAVQHRQRGTLDDSTVLVRANVRLAP